MRVPSGRMLEILAFCKKRNQAVMKLLPPDCCDTLRSGKSRFAHDNRLSVELNHVQNSCTIRRDRSVKVDQQTGRCCRCLQCGRSNRSVFSQRTHEQTLWSRSIGGKTSGTSLGKNFLRRRIPDRARPCPWMPTRRPPRHCDANFRQQILSQSHFEDSSGTPCGPLFSLLEIHDR